MCVFGESNLKIVEQISEDLDSKIGSAVALHLFLSKWFIFFTPQFPDL